MSTKETIVATAGVTAGAGYVLVASHVTWIQQSFSRLLLVPLLLLAPAVVALSLISRRPIRWTIIFLLIGIVGGVFVDAMADRTMERNLFPLEMVAWCFLVAPGLMVGTGAAYLLRRSRTASEEQ